MRVDFDGVEYVHLLPFSVRQQTIVDALHFRGQYPTCVQGGSSDATLSEINRIRKKPNGWVLTFPTDGLSHVIFDAHGVKEDALK